MSRRSIRELESAVAQLEAKGPANHKVETELSVVLPRETAERESRQVRQALEGTTNVWYRDGVTGLHSPTTSIPEGAELVEVAPEGVN